MQMAFPQRTVTAGSGDPIGESSIHSSGDPIVEQLDMDPERPQHHHPPLDIFGTTGLPPARFETPVPPRRQGHSRLVDVEEGDQQESRTTEPDCMCDDPVSGSAILTVLQTLSWLICAVSFWLNLPFSAPPYCRATRVEGALVSDCRLPDGFWISHLGMGGVLSQGIAILALTALGHDHSGHTNGLRGVHLGIGMAGTLAVALAGKECIVGAAAEKAGSTRCAPDDYRWVLFGWALGGSLAWMVFGLLGPLHVLVVRWTGAGGERARGRSAAEEEPEIVIR